MTAAETRAKVDWAIAHDRLVESLRDLIRIPSINPPDPAGPELDAARYLAAALREAGIPSTVYEPVPGRGSVVARLRGDGTGGAPLLLLSHLDVVPAPLDGWTHDPFAGDVADGWIYGRGAVDMKDLTAMELEVMRILAGEARAAGLDPATDPVPGLRRDVLFASTADEEAGGIAGAGWLAMEHPEHLLAAAAINEAGGVAVDAGSRRLYPIQVAEKGTTTYRLTFRGAWGHGSMPRLDNALLLAAEAVVRLAKPWPARMTEVTQRFLDGAIAATAATDEPIAKLLRALAAGDPRASATALEAVCSPVYARALDAMLRDTLSTNVLHAGVKYNVIPGVAILEIDCRRLPGSSEPDMEARIHRAARAGARGRDRDRSDHRLGGRRRGVRRPDRAVPGPRGGHPRRRSRWRAVAGHGAVLDRREAPARARRPDVRLLAAAPATRRDVSRPLSRDRRAGVHRRPSLGPARPLRCRPEVLRMTFVHRISRVGLVAGLVLVALVAISPVLGAAAGVSIEGTSFKPARLVVAQGDTVTWTVTSAIGDPHTVTSAKTADAAQGAAFDSQKDDPGLTKLKDTGATFEFTFDKAGTYAYLCIVHPATMTGQVVVLAPGESAPPEEPAASEAPTVEAGEPVPPERKLIGGGILVVTLVVLFAAGVAYRRMNPGP